MGPFPCSQGLRNSFPEDVSSTNVSISSVISPCSGWTLCKKSYLYEMEVGEEQSPEIWHMVVPRQLSNVGYAALCSVHVTIQTRLSSTEPSRVQVVHFIHNLLHLTAILWKFLTNITQARSQSESLAWSTEELYGYLATPARTRNKPVLNRLFIVHISQDNCTHQSRYLY